MLLVPVSSVQYGSIGTFSYRKLYKKTWYSSKISMNFINFSGVIFLNQGVLIPQNRNMSIPPGQNVLILFVNNTYIGNIRTVWHRKLYMKTWYSSKSLWIFSIFLVLTFWAQNVLMPRYSILLIAGSLGGEVDGVLYIRSVLKFIISTGTVSNMLYEFYHVFKLYFQKIPPIIKTIKQNIALQKNSLIMFTSEMRSTSR